MDGWVDPLVRVTSSLVCALQEEEMSMLGEITHLQTLNDDLKSLTMDPHKLPPASEQVHTHTHSHRPLHLNLGEILTSKVLVVCNHVQTSAVPPPAEAEL